MLADSDRIAFEVRIATYCERNFLSQYVADLDSLLSELSVDFQDKEAFAESVESGRQRREIDCNLKNVLRSS